MSAEITVMLRGAARATAKRSEKKGIACPCASGIHYWVPNKLIRQRKTGHRPPVRFG